MYRPYTSIQYSKFVVQMKYGMIMIPRSPHKKLKESEVNRQRSACLEVALGVRLLCSENQRFCFLERYTGFERKAFASQNFYVCIWVSLEKARCVWACTRNILGATLGITLGKIRIYLSMGKFSSKNMRLGNISDIHIHINWKSFINGLISQGHLQSYSEEWTKTLFFHKQSKSDRFQKHIWIQLYNTCSGEKSLVRWDLGDFWDRQI